MSSSSALRVLRNTAGSTCRARLFTTKPTASTASRLQALVNGAQCRRAFSVSTRRLGEGTSDIGVSQKLKEELNYEREAGFSTDTPQFVKEFTDKGIWTLEDISGSDEITLKRKFGNENLRLMFSIADMQSEQEPEFDGEEAESESEDSIANASPIRASLSITKTNGPGALNVDVVCQEGRFIVDNISFYKDGNLGTELTAEADWKRRGLYIGPLFDTLDVGVQEEFEKYLEERGVNESLAGFIAEYAEWKEQSEYVSWLDKVKSFIDL